MTTFRLSARIASANLELLRVPLREHLGSNGRITLDGEELRVEAELEGSSARELNRALLSALRRVEKRTRLRAEWTAEGVTERFFDYVPKGRSPA